MEELDLFRDWTPEMIESLMGIVPRGPRSEETRRKIGEANRGRIHSEETKRKRSESLKRYIGSLGLEEQEVRLENSFHSEEARRKAQQGRQKYLDSLSLEEGEERLKSSFQSEEGKRNQKKFFAEESEEAKWKRLDSTFLSPEAKRKSKEGYRKYLENLNPEEKESIFRERIERMREARMNMTLEEESRRAEGISEGLKRYWANLTPEEREVLRKHNSEAQIRLWANMTPEELKSRQINLPSIPEVILGIYLDENFPGRTGYNGDGRLGIKIGGKTPDFPFINREKKVIEMLGGFGYYHFWEDEEILIEHYKKYGYQCIVVWEWDCWIPGELDKIFKRCSPASMLK